MGDLAPARRFKAAVNHDFAIRRDHRNDRELRAGPCTQVELGPRHDGRLRIGTGRQQGRGKCRAKDGFDKHLLFLDCTEAWVPHRVTISLAKGVTHKSGVWFPLQTVWDVIFRWLPYGAALGPGSSSAWPLV